MEGGFTVKDVRKGQKEGDLEIWDPVDQVLPHISVCAIDKERFEVLR